MCHVEMFAVRWYVPAARVVTTHSKAEAAGVSSEPLLWSSCSPSPSAKLFMIVTAAERLCWVQAAAGMWMVPSGPTVTLGGGIGLGKKNKAAAHQSGGF